jgi:SH3-like domain-containing protein
MYKRFIMKTARFVLVAFVVSSIAIGSANALCVKVPKANLRVGPGKKYEIGWTVPRYFPFRKVGTSLKGDWYAVEDTDGDVLWIHRSLVTSGYRCGAVVSDKANVRTGPGTRYGKLFSEPVERYYSFRVLKSAGSWVKVRDMDNNTGWIHKNCCRIR